MLIFIEMCDFFIEMLISSFEMFGFCTETAGKCSIYVLKMLDFVLEMLDFAGEDGWTYAGRANPMLANFLQGAFSIAESSLYSLLQNFHLLLKNVDFRFLEKSCFYNEKGGLTEPC